MANDSRYPVGIWNPNAWRDFRDQITTVEPIDHF